MARSIEQIQQELESVYSPQRQQVQSQIDALPAFYAQQQSGLDQAKTNAFNDITSAANNRGMVYSGMPIQEQSRYVGTKYLPALAALSQQQNEQKGSLTQALNSLREKQMTQAQTLRQTELDREEQARQQELARQQQERQFQQQLAAQRAAAAASAAAASAMPDVRSAILSSLSNWATGDQAAGIPARQAWYTENKIIPAISGAYGMSKDAAAKLVYDLRKQYFNE